MPIAIVSDIHGNRTAFEAVIVDLDEASSVFHAGDLVDAGSRPAETIAAARSWLGRTDR